MNEVPSRQFKGVWIPAELWLNNNLTWLQKCLIAEIDSLSSKDKPCFASDAYLAEQFNVSLDRMKHLIMEVKSTGFVKTVSFDGRRRGMVVQYDSTAGVVENDTSEVSEKTPTEKPPIITGDTSLKTPPSPPKPESDTPVELPRGFPKSIKEALLCCLGAGVPDKFIENDWLDCHGRGGKDRHGQLIHHFPSHIKSAYDRRKSYEAEQKLRQPDRQFIPAVKPMDQCTVYDCL